jgi:UPF0755 protein
MAKKANLVRAGIALAAIAVVGFIWLERETQPTTPGPSRFVRYERPVRLTIALNDFERQGIVRDSLALRVLAIFQGHSQSVRAGTYRVAPGMTSPQILTSLTSPIRQNLRIPETNWANRTAHLLAKSQVLDADDYMRLVKDPAQFQGVVSFPIQGSSLEGYLYPDTYDLPPLIGARAVILRQLKNFDRKVWGKVQPKDLLRTLTIASMVQMESGRTRDLPLIAGVIENRLKKKMPLQIDSTLLYGIQKWRRLTFSDYRNIKSPYNTYTHSGLPPGPICSPTIACIEAAMNPAKHDYLYYVALPDGETLYSKDYKEHLKKIKERKHALAQLPKRPPTP